MYTTNFLNGTMKHTFRNGFEVIVDFKKNKISTLKDEKPLETVDFSNEYTLSDYDQLLVSVGNIANY